MPPPLLTLQDIQLSFGGEPLLTAAELSVAEGERLCLVGRNGSGKSSLLKIAAGLIEPDKGRRFVQPGATIRYLPQEPDFSGFDTIGAYVVAGLGPGDDPHQATRMLTGLGLTGEERPEQLSGGEARRAALARVLAPEPDILLLDEPTNHLDLTTIEWLENELKASRSALVLISHDRRFLETLSRASIWLDRGAAHRLNAGFGNFEAWRDDLLEQEADASHKLDRKISMEEDWLRYGVTARRKRNQGRLRALHELRDRRRSERRGQGQVEFGRQEAEASGKLVIEATGISKSFGERQIVKLFSLRVLRGDRIGIVGPNGAGKTTLLRMLCGSLEPDAGEIRHGARLETVVLEQDRDSLKPDWTLAEALTDGGGETVLVKGEKRHVVSYMKDFLFDPIQQRTPISRLSGGERARIMLARALAKPANLLVLDEPTNDLDLETLDLLQDLLGTFEGTVILVSHDRDFIDRVATSVIASGGDGQWTEYAGGYSDMLAQRGDEAIPQPIGRSPPPRAKSSGPKPQNRAPTKLSFKDKHALETLPDRMADLQTEVARLRERMNDSELFTRDRAAFEETVALLEQKEAELQAAEDQWLELEIKREALEGVSSA